MRSVAPSCQRTSTRPKVGSSTVQSWPSRRPSRRLELVRRQSSGSIDEGAGPPGPLVAPFDVAVRVATGPRIERHGGASPEPDRRRAPPASSPSAGHRLPEAVNRMSASELVEQLLDVRRAASRSPAHVPPRLRPREPRPRRARAEGSVSSAWSDCCVVFGIDDVGDLPRSPAGRRSVAELACRRRRSRRRRAAGDR